MKTARQKDRAATEARLLNAAETIFAEQGFAATGVREIANAAGVSVSLINRYFGSKDGRLMVLAERLSAAKREGRLSSPPQESLKDVIA
ncbi:MAG: helix-turn-helix domain-containing protein, partial [Pseudomonadota bacterium]